MPDLFHGGPPLILGIDPPVPVQLFIATQEELERYAENMGVDKRNICVVCGHEIKTMAFRGTNVCGDIHRKVRAGIPLGATSMKSY